MSGSLYGKVTDSQAGVALMLEIMSRLNDLEQRPRGIPVLDADPPVKSPVNLWYLYDGRLRGRNPSTGAIMQFQTMTPGGTSTTVARPTPTVGKQQYIGVYSASWGRTYLPNGTPGSNTELRYGQAITGQMMRPLFGFPRSTIQSDIGGGAVQRVELRVKVNPILRRTQILAIGGHPANAEPAAWSDLLLPPGGATRLTAHQLPDNSQLVQAEDGSWVRRSFYTGGAAWEYKWHVLPIWFGTELVAGRIGSIGVDQTLIGVTEYGAAIPAPPDAEAPQLRITFVA